MATVGRPKEYTRQVARVIESVIRRTKSLRQARRVLASDYDGPWGKNGPSMKTLRRVYQEMDNPPTLSVGGHPPYYTSEQRREMARLAVNYGITGPTGAMAILRAQNNTWLARRRDRRVFPSPVRASEPTISEAVRNYKAKVNGS